MANLYDSHALSGLNEDQYVNKIHDDIHKKQKDTLDQNYQDVAGQLDAGQKQTQAQTEDYLHRTQVEQDKLTGGYRRPDDPYKAQRELALGNQFQQNNGKLNQQQDAADQEFERQRKLLGEKYAAEIQKAQRDNDMHRAQMLYEAAKAEEEQLRALRQQAAGALYSKGDKSFLDAIARGEGVSRDSSTPTWEGVLKNEEQINKIYDNQMESARLESQMEREKALSDLEAQQAQQTRQTDENLTKAYVAALKNGQNYRQTQTARGQGSGTAAQAQLARDNQLTQKLTELRRLQQGGTAEAAQKKAQIQAAYGDAIAKAQAEGDLKRVEALYKAAEEEEQKLLADQQFVGNQLAQQGDYSVLGKLWGLTQDQIDRLQGTGQYAPVYEEPKKKKKYRDRREQASLPVLSGGGGGGTFRDNPQHSRVDRIAHK